jgi:hypothetical protein
LPAARRISQRNLNGNERRADKPYFNPDNGATHNFVTILSHNLSLPPFLLLRSFKRFMSNNLALEIESIISRLQPPRLELLEAEQHFHEQLDHVYHADKLRP